MKFLLFVLALLLLAFRGENLAIIGVIHSTVPAHNLIMVRVGSKKYFTRLGYWFANRYRVVRVQPRYVTLESLNGTVILRIGEADKRTEELSELSDEELSELSDEDPSKIHEDFYYYPHTHYPTGPIYRLVYPPEM